jgi:hypothetical protein
MAIRQINVKRFGHFSSKSLGNVVATRADSHKAEVPGASHAVYVCRSREVAALNGEAASRALEETS